MEKKLLYYYHIVKGGKVTTREFKKKALDFSNYSTFRDMANEEFQQIQEWVKANHTPDYFFNTNTV